MIASVGSFPVKYIDMTMGTASRPVSTIPKFNMGMLPLSSIIFGSTYHLEEVDSLSMGVFIESLYEWLPEEFAGNTTLLADNTWVSL